MDTNSSSDTTVSVAAGDTYSPAAWRILFALCTGFFMMLLDSTIVAVALPDIQHELNVTNYSSIIWVSSAYLLTYAVPLLVAARMGDKFGAKNMYIIGTAVFTLASLACGLSSTIEQLIVWRAVQGLGAGLMTPQTMSIITRIFPPTQRGRAMGVWGAVAGLATLLGPVVGGILTDFLNWSWIFYINVPLGVLSIALVYLWVPQLPRTLRNFDIPGVILSMAAVFAIVFALQEASNANWAGWIWALLGSGIFLLVLFLYWEDTVEKQGKEPLVALSIFQNRSFSLGNIAITMMGFCIGGFNIPIMLYLQEIHHFSALQAGLLMIPSAVISGVLAPFVGKLTDTASPRGLSQLGFGLMFLSVLPYVFIIGLDFNPYWVLIPSALGGVANAFIWAPNSATTMRNLSKRQAGTASGIYNTTRQVGAVVGSAAIATVISAQIMHGDFAGKLGISMLIPSVALIIAFIAVSFFPKTLNFDIDSDDYLAQSASEE